VVGHVFEIREFTLQDGPGPRTTVFMQGCPLRCTWCHNPEGQEFGGGREVSVEDVVAEVMRTADFLAASGGGVTFSGGEPLAQADFIVSVIDRLRVLEPRLTFAMETSGYASSEEYRKAVSRADMVLQDVKFPDLEGYRRWTGVDATPIFANLEWLKSSGIPFVARVPCMPGVNDSCEVKSAIARLLRGAANLLKVELLPYNRMAGAKYARLGRAYEPGFDEGASPDLSMDAFESIDGL